LLLFCGIVAVVVAEGPDNFCAASFLFDLLRFSLFSQPPRQWIKRHASGLGVARKGSVVDAAVGTRNGGQCVAE
jgi:hypothetical protein